MPIYAREPDSKFTPCPEGLHQAVCVDVIDLGTMVTQWGDKPKVRIVWQIEDEDPQTGQRFDVRGLYTLSLSEKATLRKHLEAWRGRKFSAAELRGFDLENLIGVNCQIQVIHHVSDEGRTFANVQAIVPVNAKMPKLTALNYTRERPPAADPFPVVAASRDVDPVPF